MVLMRPPMPVASANFVGVNHIEFELLVDNGLLVLRRATVLQTLSADENAVEQEDAAGFGVLEDVQPLQEGELVTGDEVGIVFNDQIRAGIGLGPKRRCEMVTEPDFFRVVNKITLGIEIGFFTNDLDRVLVGAHSAISTQTKEHATHSFFWFDGEAGVIVQAGSWLSRR